MKHNWANKNKKNSASYKEEMADCKEHIIKIILKSLSRRHVPLYLE